MQGGVCDARDRKSEWVLCGQVRSTELSRGCGGQIVLFAQYLIRNFTTLPLVYGQVPPRVFLSALRCNAWD